MIEAIAPTALRTGRWVASAADGKMPQVTRSDCVASAVAVLTTPGHTNTTYNITGPDLLSFREISVMIAQIAGKLIEYHVVDDEGMYAFFDSFGIPREATGMDLINGFPWSSNDMVSMERAIRLGHMEVVSNDVLKLTGRPPQSLRSFALERQSDLKVAACEGGGRR